MRWCGVTLYTVCEVVRSYRMWCGVVLHVRGVMLFACGVMLHVHCLVWCYMYNVCDVVGSYRMWCVLHVQCV